MERARLSARFTLQGTIEQLLRTPGRSTVRSPGETSSSRRIFDEWHGFPCWMKSDHGSSMMQDGLECLTGSPADFRRPDLASILNTATLFPGMFAHMLAADQKCSAAAKTGRRTKSAAHNCAVL